jgi:hypothetical protein
MVYDIIKRIKNYNVHKKNNEMKKEYIIDQ